MEKILHFIWWQGVADAPETLQSIPFQWGRLNPHHRIMLWDGELISDFVRKNYPAMREDFENIGRDEPVNVAIIKKCDFARLLILHHHGGVYVDLDCVPIRPLSLLFDQNTVRHRGTRFGYSRNGSAPTALREEDEDPVEVDWSRYELVFSREHLPSGEVGGCLAANTVLAARRGSSLLTLLAGEALARKNVKVLEFAGPLGISRSLLANLDTVRGRAFSLPPYYFLWQEHDMGEPWEHTICCHMNRLDWADKTKPVPWDI